MMTWTCTCWVMLRWCGISKKRLRVLLQASKAVSGAVGFAASRAAGVGCILVELLPASRMRRARLQNGALA